MSIEKITSKILDEAEGIRKEALAETDKKCDAIIAEAKMKAQKIVDEMTLKGQEEKEKIVLRKKSVASIDSRKIILSKKQEIINSCFNDAVDKIADLPKEEYIDFLVSLGKDSDMYGGLLTFNKRDTETIAQDVIDRLNDAMEQKQLEKYGDLPYRERFSLNEQYEPLRGGYWIRYRFTYADNTLESQVEVRKKTFASEISKLLFDEE